LSIWIVAAANSCRADATNSLPQELSAPALTNTVEVNPPTVATNLTAPPDAFTIRRLELLAPFRRPPITPASFPINAPAYAVTSMAYGDSRLWIGVRPRTSPQLPNFYSKLWMFNPEANSLEKVDGAINQHVVQNVKVSGQRLWMTTEIGVGEVDTRTFGFEVFDSTRGITSESLAGVADADQTISVMSRSGALYYLGPGGTNFNRVPGLPPTFPNSGPEPWQFFAASHQWLLAAGQNEVVTRHTQGREWTSLKDGLSKGAYFTGKPVIQCVESDGEGGFWIGSDVGLHWVRPETGAVENRFAPQSVVVPGGLNIPISPWLKPTPVAYHQAHGRMMDGIRDRMRDRARLARLSGDAHTNISPVFPTSRLMGGVTAILRDKGLLWVATSDGRNTNHSRVMLYHPLSRKWVGWFAVAAPVWCMAVNEQWLFLGMEVGSEPRASPLAAVAKAPLTTIPTRRWVPDEISVAEIEARLSSMTVKERANFWFFSGNPERTVSLLAPDGTPAESADAESLFLLTFAHDSVGLDKPEEYERYFQLLSSRFPRSYFTELAQSVRPAPVTVVKTTAEAAATDEGMTSEEAIRRRDLDGDGRLNRIEFRLWKGATAEFERFDLNHDGFLDATEIEPVLKAR
jgi:EF hand